MLQRAAVSLSAQHPVALQDAVKALCEVIGQVALLQIFGLEHGLRPHCNGLPLPLSQSCTTQHIPGQAYACDMLGTGPTSGHKHDQM